MIAANPDFQAFKPLLKDLEKRFPEASLDKVIIISAAEQYLYYIQENQITSYPISTAKAGLGNLSGSFKTPLGVHKIAKKIGEGARLGTIFKARKTTNKTAKILIKADEKNNNDIITTRILWLKGMEEGLNHGGNVDSYQRYIYIHGTDEEGRLGTPASHGCIRLGNLDVIELFDRVDVGTIVNIVE